MKIGLGGFWSCGGHPGDTSTGRQTTWQQNFGLGSDLWSVLDLEIVIFVAHLIVAQLASRHVNDSQT